MAVIIISVDDAGKVTGVRRDESAKLNDQQGQPGNLQPVKDPFGRVVVVREGGFGIIAPKFISDALRSPALTPEQRATAEAIFKGAQPGDTFAIQHGGSPVTSAKVNDGAAAPASRKPITRFVDP